MDQAVQYVESLDAFVKALEATAQNVVVRSGHKFDRIEVDGEVEFFINKQTWEIFGAKSAGQYNPRRQYGTVETVDQFDWVVKEPHKESAAYPVWKQREDAIKATHKPRGRPKKVAP